MSNINDDKLDRMLKSYFNSNTETFTFTKPKRLKHTALIAACLVLVILAGIIFIPSLLPEKEHSFIIVANAQSLDEEGLASADEITEDFFVEIENVCGNLVEFDFDEVLWEDAPLYDMTKNLLFLDFITNLNINVAGEDIKTVTYKFNSGAFSPTHINARKDEEHLESLNHTLIVGHDSIRTEYTYDYDKDYLIQLTYNPVYDSDATYESVGRYISSPNEYVKNHSGYNKNEKYVYSENKDELVEKYGWAKIVDGGYRCSAPSVVTDEERATLREYAIADDMIGFFNFQNGIFKRLIDGTTIDITVTFNSGEKQTKTLELMYTPKELTAEDWYIEWYADLPSNTPSNGNISARIAG